MPSTNQEQAVVLLISSITGRVLRIVKTFATHSFSPGALTALESMRAFVAALKEADANGQLDDLASGQSVLVEWGPLGVVGDAEILRGLFDIEKVTVTGDHIDLGGVDVATLSMALQTFEHRFIRLS